MLKPIAAAAMLFLVTGCASLPTRLACASGDHPMTMAQLFFGQNIGGKPAVTDADFRRFTEEVLTPRFPDGLTVMDGGGQWKGPDQKLIRESTKVVMLVVPDMGTATRRKLGEVRQAYIQRYRQDAVMMVTQKACVSI